MRPSMRPLKPESSQKNQQMARPFEIPTIGLFPLRPTAPQRANIIIDKGFQNRYTDLAGYPKLEVNTPTNLISQKISQESTSSSVQTKESYTMKAPKTFAQAVKPLTGKKPDTPPTKEEFKFLTNLIKPVYLNNNFVDTDNPLKTQRYFEAILVDTESIIIEHTMSDKNPEYISYSKFTIKRVLSPSEWHANHLLTLITLSMPHKPQTYNWHDYKNAWFNFLYIRPGHTWFVKYCPNMAKTIIPRWFYEWWSYFGGNREILPQQFLSRLEELQIKEEISTLPEHIKICK
ncbi:hypothetical protein H5410_050046 [Solanum commersonii]|uniref:Uncharacterized protein n=1 Tax=Solanum commersonii TaxID=4109 RepID=A0A9J5WU85_SOLCO|nr:hypothetical protein H5410_050046 [Solanum commersonii]